MKNQRLCTRTKNQYHLDQDTQSFPVPLLTYLMAIAPLWPTIKVKSHTETVEGTHFSMTCIKHRLFVSAFSRYLSLTCSLNSGKIFQLFLIHPSYAGAHNRIQFQL